MHHTYTAQLLSVTADKAYPNISISTIQFFKDGVPLAPASDYRGFTEAEAKHFCKQEIARYVSLDAQTAAIAAQQTDMAAFIINPPLGDIDLSDPDPTPDQVLQQAINKAQALKVQVDLGIIEADDAGFVQAVEEAKAAMPLADQLADNIRKP